MFEACYRELIAREKYAPIRERFSADVSKIHNGYFSQDKKGRQKVGLGLRLFVNQDGERVEDRDINVLHVMANESFAEFAATLQKEIGDETGVKFGILNLSLFTGMVYEETHQEERTVTAEQAQKVVEVLQTAGAIDRLGKVQPAAKVEEIALPQELMEHFQEKDYITPAGKIKQKTTYRVSIDTEELVKRCVKTLREMPKLQKTRLVSQIADIHLEQAGVSHTERESRFIDGICYLKLDGEEYYAQEIFDSAELLANLDRNAVKVEHSVYDYIVYDSATVEKPFALALDRDPDAKMFFKIPERFKIETPIGTYSPDWAVYFILETKGTSNLFNLRTPEQLKTHCGQKHFEALDEVEMWPEPVTDWGQVKKRIQDDINGPSVGAQRRAVQRRPVGADAYPLGYHGLHGPGGEPKDLQPGEVGANPSDGTGGGVRQVASGL